MEEKENKLICSDGEVQRLLYSHKAFIIRPIEPQPSTENRDGAQLLFLCPYKAGSQWWIAETICLAAKSNSKKSELFCYRADKALVPNEKVRFELPNKKGLLPASKCPFSASRLLIEVNKAKQNRIKDWLVEIREKKSGIDSHTWNLFIDSIKEDWQIFNTDLPFDKNPWVWILDVCVMGKSEQRVARGSNRP